MVLVLAQIKRPAPFEEEGRGREGARAFSLFEPSFFGVFVNIAITVGSPIKI